MGYRSTPLPIGWKATPSFPLLAKRGGRTRKFWMQHCGALIAEEQRRFPEFHTRSNNTDDTKVHEEKTIFFYKMLFTSTTSNLFDFLREPSCASLLLLSTAKSFLRQILRQIYPSIQLNFLRRTANQNFVS